MKTIKIAAISGLLFVGFFTWFLMRSSAERGEELAKTHCSSCHQFPEPSILPKAVWEKTLLPEMKKRMGLGDLDEMLKRMSYDDFTYYSEKGIYPLNPRVSEKDWQKIVDYYLKNAPEKPLPQAQKQPNVAIEKATYKEILGENLAKSGTTFFGVHGDKIFLSNVKGYLTIEKLTGGEKLSLQLPSPLVQIKEDLLLCAGGDMSSTEAKLGGLFKLNLSKSQVLEPIIWDLHRPVDFLYEDFNKDGTKDFVIAEFGFETGELSFIDGKSMKKRSLSKLPGARNFVVRDSNKDGLLDFYVLFAQAKEQVSLFKNKGNGEFEEIVQISLPSHYGTSYLEMSDLDNDGQDEIILASGDNADYSITKKNFHGIRTYKQTLANHWKLLNFFPVYGATKVLTIDINKDGKMDLVSASNFVEEEFRATETLLCFFNKGKMQFGIKHIKLPKINPLTLSIAEINGQKELFLGNFQFQPTPLKGLRIPINWQ